MNGLLVFFVLANLYVLLLLWLHRTGRLGQSFDVVLGFLLMWRTQWGKRTIDRIARAQRFWRVAGDVGIFLTVLAGTLTLLVVVLSLFLFAAQPRQAASNTPGAEYLLGIPGVNPLIPLWYGIFALAVALIIHEGCHGILARAENIRVKSLGLLFAIVPVGAFVEPDEEDMERATGRARNRMLAAGPSSNIVVAVLTAVLFSGLLMGSLDYTGPEDGVLVTGVVPDSAADSAGLVAGDVITRVDAKAVDNVSAFQSRMANLSAGAQVQLTWIRDGETRSAITTLGDRDGRPFLGIGLADVAIVPAYQDILEDPLQSGGAFVTYIYHPVLAITAFDPLAEPYRDFFTVTGPLDALSDDAFFIIANGVYWVFWLNLMLGTFNALPMGFLDGGQMLKTSLRSYLFRRYDVKREDLVVEREPEGPGVMLRGRDDATQAKLDSVHGIVRRATWTVGLTVLAMLLLPIVGGNLLRLLGLAG